MNLTIEKKDAIREALSRAAEDLSYAVSQGNYDSVDLPEINAQLEEWATIQAELEAEITTERHIAGEIVGPGPGCMDTVMESFSADVALHLSAQSSDGDTIASLHLVTSNQDPELASVVQSVGIELTAGDLKRISHEATLIRFNHSPKERS